MKEILDTILDPSSQTEDFAALPLPEAYRAVTLLLPPVLFQAGIGMTPTVTSRKLLGWMRSRPVFSSISGSGRKTNDSKIQEER